MKRLILTTGLAVMLGGCGATPYKDGYGNSQLSHNVFKINSRVNGFSETGREDDIAMLRAADIACHMGYDHFDVLNSQRTPPNGVRYFYMTIELKRGSGTYAAPIIMRALKVKLDAETECNF
ncbi:MAG: hypothetical protein JAY71_18790 [Candidatus Thiodiazotropha weberae]|nr:hypothetical protein [Candidatus Thiodiazotropha weberae]